MYDGHESFQQNFKIYCPLKGQALRQGQFGPVVKSTVIKSF